MIHHGTCFHRTKKIHRIKISNVDGRGVGGRTLFVEFLYIQTKQTNVDTIHVLKKQNTFLTIW